MSAKENEGKEKKNNGYAGKAPDCTDDYILPGDIMPAGNEDSGHNTCWDG
jgi:hypothetical protein